MFLWDPLMERKPGQIMESFLPASPEIAETVTRSR
jgi:hypothetical protein